MVNKTKVLPYTVFNHVLNKFTFLVLPAIQYEPFGHGKMKVSSNFEFLGQK